MKNKIQSDRIRTRNQRKEEEIGNRSTENNKNDNSGGIQKVYYKSPLASSLLGHNVGDIVKIGNLDNFVEILKISND